MVDGQGDGAGNGAGAHGDLPAVDATRLRPAGPERLNAPATDLNNGAIPARHEVLHPAVSAVAAAALGPDAPRLLADRPADHAVQSAVQARLLADLLDRQGPRGVLLAGRHLDTVAREPIVLALLTSEDPGRLLDKIDRLNRFLHSSHRHRVLRQAPERVELEHVSTTGRPPSPVESLFACGLYLELLTRIGCRTLSCAFPEAATGPRDVYRDGNPDDVPERGTRRWDIRWAGFTATHALPGLDEVLLRDLPADLTDRSLATRVEAVLRADLAHAWTLDEVATRLATSRRTLQRHLREEGRPFTAVLTAVRLAAAQDLLRDPDRTITDVGYLTGFADTAHFTRTFRRLAGRTPSQWRSTARSSAPPSRT